MAKQNAEGRNQESESRGQNPEARIQNPEFRTDLAGENAALRARLAEMESAKIQNDADEKIIVAKMSRGLRREQARAVIYRQREFDSRRKAAAKTS
jgi:hypothetical protein